MRELSSGHGNCRVPCSPSQTVSLLLSLWNLSRALSAPSLGVITATGRARQGAPARSAGNGKGLGRERLQPVAPLELAKMLTPQPCSPGGMEPDYPRQNEGGNPDDAFASC